MGRIQIKAEDVLDAPERIAPSPFANFLRYFRRKHPRMDLRRVLREAPVIWRQLTKRQRNLFEKQVWERKGKETISRYFISHLSHLCCSAFWPDLHALHMKNVCVC